MSPGSARGPRLLTGDTTEWKGGPTVFFSRLHKYHVTSNLASAASLAGISLPLNASASASKGNHSEVKMLGSGAHSARRHTAGLHLRRSRAKRKRMCPPTVQQRCWTPARINFSFQANTCVINQAISLPLSPSLITSWSKQLTAFTAARQPGGPGGPGMRYLSKRISANSF